MFGKCRHAAEMKRQHSFSVVQSAATPSANTAERVHVESFIFHATILQRMSYSRVNLAGVLFFIAVTQFALGLIISEALYHGYGVHDNYLSDLGIGPSAIIFNASAFLLGLLSLLQYIS